MSFVFIILALAVAPPSWANETDHSEVMVKVLLDAGVKPWGRKQNLQAEVSCKIDRHEIFRCKIAGHHYRGDEAITISELLKTFDVYPVGRRKNQEGSILCRIEKNDTVHTCEDLSYDYPTN